MSDIFNEIDEDIRRERLRKLWDKYGIFIIALAVLIVGGIGGWRAYEAWQASRAAQAGASYERALLLEQEGKSEEAKAAFAQLAAEAPPNYRRLARMREAAALAESDRKAAVAIYDEVAADAGAEQALRDAASLRAGMLLADSAPLDELTSRLQPLTADGRAFRHSARLVLALAAWRAEDIAAARRWAEAITGDPQAPQNARGQAEMLLSLTAANAEAKT